MCGIVGYVGTREAAPILVEGLRRLEYRGYDSAGLAVHVGRGVVARKLAGRVAALADLVQRLPAHGTCGIAHTRWATHGAPTERNAHPHTDCRGEIAVVHNGIIENADALRIKLERSGHRFTTETDTETLAHLIEEAPGDTLEDRVLAALTHVEGTYGLAVVSAAEPGKIVEVLGLTHAEQHGGALAARAAGCRVLGIVNVVGSTIAREADGGIYLHAGPEIGVASTKAFTSQIVALLLLGLYLGRQRGLSLERGQELVCQLAGLPALVTRALALEPQVRVLAERYSRTENFLYLGRGVNFPVALEGALKLKEISYIHAEGYPAAEMKHGPIALIDENMPVVFVAPHDKVYPKVLSNMQEVKARGGRIIALTSEGNGDLRGLVEHQLLVPASAPLLSPVLTVVPLQLLAYHIAVLRGCDVDRPRNLAKSVTVE